MYYGRHMSEGRRRLARRKKDTGRATEASSEVEEVADEDDDDTEEISIPSTPITPDVNAKGKARLPGVDFDAKQPSPKGKGKALPKPIVRLKKSKPTGQRLGSSSSSKASSRAPKPLGGYPPVFWTEVFSRPDGMNRIVGVAAVKEDGYCRDVTPRSLRDDAAKTAKAQLQTCTSN